MLPYNIIIYTNHKTFTTKAFPLRHKSQHYFDFKRLKSHITLKRKQHLRSIFFTPICKKVSQTLSNMIFKLILLFIISIHLSESKYIFQPDDDYPEYRGKFTDTARCYKLNNDIYKYDCKIVDNSPKFYSAKIEDCSVMPAEEDYQETDLFKGYSCLNSLDKVLLIHTSQAKTCHPLFFGIALFKLSCHKFSDTVFVSIEIEDGKVTYNYKQDEECKISSEKKHSAELNKCIEDSEISGYPSILEAIGFDETSGDLKVVPKGFLFILLLLIL